MLDEHISGGHFSRVYLLYGPESYLRGEYAKKLERAIMGEDSDDMNITRFSGEMDSIEEFMDTAVTLPFFAERRLIVVEDSQLFKASSNGKARPAAEELAGRFDEIPESTCIIFNETAADKRFKLYKKAAGEGTEADFEYLTGDELLGFIGRRLRAADVGITRKAAELLVERVGQDLNLLNNEADKIIAYFEGKTITPADVESIAAVRAEDKIFDMLREAMQGKVDKAMEYYQDLLSLRESPIKILVLAGQQCAKTLSVKQCMTARLSEAEMMSKLSMSSGAIYHTKELARAFSIEQLEKGVSLAAEYDEAVKSGNLDQQLAAELLLVGLAGLST